MSFGIIKDSSAGITERRLVILSISKHRRRKTKQTFQGNPTRLSSSILRNKGEVQLELNEGASL